MDLSVPGVNVAVTKRPYDIDLHLLVQDLCLVDRIQTFGPEYELVVCSSGKTILSSPFGESPPKEPFSKIASSLDYRSQSCPNFNSLGSKPRASTSGTSLEDPATPLNKDDSHVEDDRSPTNIFSATMVEDSSDALLSLRYTRADPYSPLHPAAGDRAQAEGGVVGVEGVVVGVEGVAVGVEGVAVGVEGVTVGVEPTVQNVIVKCTAIDAIGKL